MNRRILVPLDGMPLAEKALPLARVLAGVLDADLELMQVVEQGHATPADAELRAWTYLDGVSASLGANQLELARRVLHGKPGACIVQQAAADHVASVVMTTHARSGLRRAVLGSVAEYVVAHCPSPTVLTRGDVVVPRGLRTVLVTIDASSAAPLETLVELAANHDVRVVLLRVLAPQDMSIWQWRSGPVLDEPQVVLIAREELEDVASRLGADGIRADAHVAVGSAVPVIDAFAERIDADLIVMTSHARMGAQRAVQGSVMDAVMRTARRSVMVCRLVPPPPHEPDPLDLAHAMRHSPPPLIPQTIPEPADGIRHRTPSAPWKHLSGVT
jgi:nucleotide-binding universal stress UspA family protein